MEKNLAIPDKDGWVTLEVSPVDTIMYDGSRVAIPAHPIQVALRYPTWEGGEPVVNITQQGVADLMRGYPEFKGGLTLHEDQLLRDTFGNIHTIFDENYQRNGMPWCCGYVLDFSRPYSEGADGVEVDGRRQRLVRREIGYRLPDGDEILGITAIAPSGMVPLLTKAELEEYGIKLTDLEKLGVPIPGDKDAIVNPWDALGYPKLTFPHDYKRDGILVPHSYHVYTPAWNDNVRVGVRSAHWHLHGGDWCFRVRLDIKPEDLHSGRSFPLVRGDSVEARCERAFQF